MAEIRAGGHVIGEHGWEVATATPSPATWDPADHNISDVLAYVEENPDETEAVLEAEKAGKNRVTLVEALENSEE